MSVATHSRTGALPARRQVQRSRTPAAADEPRREGLRSPAEEAAARDVLQARQGDPVAFERLVLEYQDDVVNAAYYFLGNYEDAVDAAQEAFWKAYRGLRNFRGNSSFKTWILTIALNTARSLKTRQRAKKRSGKTVRLDQPQPCSADPDFREAGLEVPDPDTSCAPARLLERKELVQAIQRAISDLDEESRQVIVLRDISGESYEAMAAFLEIPLGTVKSRVHRARLELQEKLGPLV